MLTSHPSPGSPAIRILALLGLASAFLTGCGVHNPALQVGTALSGNWAFTGNNGSPALNLGFMQGAYENVTAVAHLTGADCMNPSTDILLTGSVGGENQLILVSQPFAGTTLVVKGDVAANGQGITGATMELSGGTCASLGALSATATNFTQIAGTYSGTFTDNSGDKIPVTAFLEQTTEPNGDGQFTLSGTATFPDNTCFTDQPTLTQSLVTGENLSMTYVDPGTGAVLAASGTLNSAATQLTITAWSITGGNCGGDSGTGLLTSATAVE